MFPNDSKAYRCPLPTIDTKTIQILDAERQIFWSKPSHVSFHSAFQRFQVNHITSARTLKGCHTLGPDKKKNIFLGGHRPS